MSIKPIAYLEVDLGLRANGLIAFTFYAKEQEYYDNDDKRTIMRNINNNKDIRMGFAYHEDRILSIGDKYYISVNLLDDKRNDDFIQWVSFPEWRMNVSVDRNHLHEVI